MNTAGECLKKNKDKYQQMAEIGEIAMTINIDLNNNILRESLHGQRGIPEVVMMIPAYYRLYMLLRGELKDGVTKPLPTTQKALSDQYGVCRATASAALALLRRDGLVNQGRRGRPSLQA